MVLGGCQCIRVLVNERGITFQLGKKRHWLSTRSLLGPSTTQRHPSELPGLGGGGRLVRSSSLCRHRGALTPTCIPSAYHKSVRGWPREFRVCNPVVLLLVVLNQLFALIELTNLHLIKCLRIENRYFCANLQISSRRTEDSTVWRAVVC